jgi:hypothetical protein
MGNVMAYFSQRGATPSILIRGSMHTPVWSAA